MSLDEDRLHPGFKSDLAIPPECRERYLCTPTNRNDVFRRVGIDYAGLSDLVPGYHARRFQCWHHILLFTLVGRGRLLHEGQNRALEAGSLCVLPAGLSHEYFPEGNWSLLWIHPVPGDFWASLIGNEIGVHPSLNGSFLHTIAERLWMEMERQEAGTAEAVTLLAELFLHFLRRELEQGSDNTLRRWRLHMDRLWTQVAAQPGDWSVARLCRAVGTSRTTLVRLCGQLYGYAPHERILELRMNRAREFLLNTDWTLQRIATKLGYCDEFSFSRAFSRHCGEAPSQFRKRMSPE